MLGFKSTTRPPFSKNIYAFDLDSFDPETGNIECIWVRRIRGVFKLSCGTYHTFTTPKWSAENKSPKFRNALEAIDNTDLRYGGDWVANLHGEQFTWNHRYQPNLDEMLETERHLASLSSSLPNVPEGYSGWFVARN